MNGRRGVSPDAGFVGGPALTRTRATKTKVTLSTRKTDTLGVSGSVSTSVTGPSGLYADPTNSTVLTSSLYLEGSVSFGRGYDRRKLTSQILGLPVYGIDRSPWPSETVVDVTSTGTFVSPSWSRSYLGFNQGFVQNALSSSYRHETIGMNLAFSGTQAVETSPVPASTNLFYSKQNRLQTIVVKHTASFFDTVPPSVSGAVVPSSFAAGTGTLCAQVTGVNVPLQVNTVNNPASIFINVPVSGLLVDIKVWVELVHLSGSPNRYNPLSALGISLVSPNVTWGHAHPIYNDPLFYRQAGIASKPAPLPNFYKDSFVLWEGAMAAGAITAVTVGGGSPDDIHGGFNTVRYPTWDRDRSMRTIFCDGAPVGNPREHYAAASGGMSGTYLGAPNAWEGSASNRSDAFAMNSAWGNNVPWTSDATVFPATESYQRAGSPPRGWLNGAGGAADVNEWPTTGVNYGANQIRPVYPMLDPIYVKKSITSERTFGAGILISDAPVPTPDLWRGFRPGLRGTEISGTWRLQLFNNFSLGLRTDTCDLYFRQVRLEITYETPAGSHPRAVRASSPRTPRTANAERLLWQISGSDFSNVGSTAGPNFDWYPTQIYTRNPSDSDVGKTIGLVLNSGSVDSNYALLYRLTGTLGDAFGPTPAWLTRNQFGMPAIPLSSATLAPPRPTLPVTAPPAGFISPIKALDGARRLADVVNDINPPRKLSQLAEHFVSTVLLSGTSDA
ncbi:MAG TPA: hypothetical protein VFT74_19065 [Isosphaeraceae bacterium]|nr:hypothetical protein [Isosphaeraceae bacterium]